MSKTQKEHRTNIQFSDIKQDMSLEAIQDVTNGSYIATVRRWVFSLEILKKITYDPQFH
jgi:hypothetical protein